MALLPFRQRNGLYSLTSLESAAAKAMDGIMDDDLVTASE